MATRSLIAIEKDINLYNASYCHFDGYPEGNGKTLKEHYLTEDKVDDLLSNGEMSFLRPTIENSSFYKDRGETLRLIGGVTFERLKKIAENAGCEYIYVFFPERNVWQYAELENNFCSMKNI